MREGVRGEGELEEGEMREGVRGEGGGDRQQGIR